MSGNLSTYVLLWATLSGPPTGSNRVSAPVMPMSYEHFAATFLLRTTAEWEALLDSAGVPASRVRTMSELLAEGQPQARQLLKEVAVGSADTAVSLPAIGFRLNGDSLQPTHAPRKNGQDNDKYLT